MIRGYDSGVVLREDIIGGGKVMIFQISYQKKADPNKPEIRTCIVSFQVVRNEKPPPEEVAQIVLKHSGGDFLEAPIKIKEV
jgi:hypothetical protein